MAEAKRNIGLEILEGIREIKRGEHRRVKAAGESTRLDGYSGVLTF